MMSPYAFYQFWLNVEDEKVGELLRIFTFLSREEIEALERQTPEKPFLRAGQKALAEQVTTLVHGAEETERIKAASAALFGGGDLHELEPGHAWPRPCARPAPRRWPRRRHARRRRPARRRPASPRARARPDAPSAEGGAYLNNERVEDPEHVPAETTCSVASGWCCAAARRTSPACASREADPTPGRTLQGPVRDPPKPLLTWADATVRRVTGCRFDRPGRVA